jgi:hypothetical protein
MPFYIGKGKGDRMYHHLKESSSKKENKDKWQIISVLNANGTPPIIKILENNIKTELLAFNREDYYILYYGRKGIDENGILTNKTIGGKQPPTPIWDDKKKQQHSDWNKHYWTNERKLLHPTRHSIDTVSVTDKLGVSKRIPKSVYDNMDKSSNINTWEYVSVSSKESKRRKQLNHP